MQPHTPHDHAPREHKARARATGIRFGVLTVSDSRSTATDASGDACARGILGAGHVVARRALVRDEIGEIRAAVEAWLMDAEVDIVVATGGTGIAARDVTPEAVAPLLERSLPGFGELFRMLSFREIGSPAMLTRAEAGVSRAGRKPVFLLPGSPDACRLAMDRLVLPESGHLHGLLHPE